MDERRVKLYGFYPVTRQRYLIQSAIEWAGFGALLAGWFWGWPILAKRLAGHELPTTIAVIRTILANAHWLVIALAVVKTVEMILVLRAFRRSSTTRSTTDG